MPDYVKLAATAKRLIEASGRNITFRKLAQQLDSPTEPWRGGSTVRSTPELEETVKGVLVDAVSGAKMGFLLEDQELINQISLVGLVAADSSEEDLEIMDEVVDAGILYKVQRVDVLKPGDVKLLYVFSLTSVGPLAGVAM